MILVQTRAQPGSLARHVTDTIVSDSDQKESYRVIRGICFQADRQILQDRNNVVFFF
jgi:hypothetical protein